MHLARCRLIACRWPPAVYFDADGGEREGECERGGEHEGEGERMGEGERLVSKTSPLRLTGAALSGGDSIESVVDAHVASVERFGRVSSALGESPSPASTTSPRDSLAGEPSPSITKL